MADILMRSTLFSPKLSSYYAKPLFMILIKSIVFMLMFMIVDRSTYALLKKASKYAVSGDYVINAVIKTRPDIIILGASRAQNHYVSSLIFEDTGLSTYNLGYGGSSVLLQYAQLLTILQSYNPKLIIYEIMGDDFSEWFSMPHSVAPLMVYNDIVEISEILAKLDKYHIYKSYIKSYQFNGNIYLLASGVLHRQSLSMDCGYVPIYESNLPQLLKMKPKAKEEVAFSSSQVIKKAFNDMLILASNNQANMLFLRSPYYKDIRSPINSQIDPAVKDLISQYQYPLYDINEHYSCEFNDPKLFKDFGHMTDLGARMYTKKIMPLIIHHLKSSTHSK